MLLLLKLFSVVRSITSYIIDLFTRYPLQILLVLVCLYAFWQKTRYDDVAKEYQAYKASIVQAGKMQQLKNDILRKQAEQSLQDAQLTYDNNLKAIKNEYLKKQKLDSVTIADLRGRLRETLTADTFAVPETPENTGWTSQEWADSHRAIIAKYESLALACAMTTNEYNLLRDWADAACEQVGCN